MTAVPSRERRKALAVIIASQVAGMSVWFSASAAVPSLILQGVLLPERASWLTGAVQLGFVAGTLVSAVFGLPDRLDPRRLFALAALLGAVANALLLAAGLQDGIAILLRFVTGIAMAGVYPVGMKLAAGWAERNMGLMIGLLVGSVTLGSSLPHLFTAFQMIDWRLPIIISSALALLAAAAILTLDLGPHHVRSGAFSLDAARRLLGRRPMILVNLGYLGHMWELYAMWAWLGSFVVWAWAQHHPGAQLAGATTALLTFLVIAAGAPGCVIAGLLADRLGRTATTIGAMAVSGACGLLIGPVAVISFPLMVGLALIWGLTVVADSAQFSASAVELTDPAVAGTALTMQTCLGFLLTFFIIQTLPHVVALVTWKYAFTFLSIGPALGILSMLRLRGVPEARRIAGGLR